MPRRKSLLKYSLSFESQTAESLNFEMTVAWDVVPKFKEWLGSVTLEELLTSHSLARHRCNREFGGGRRLSITGIVDVGDMATLQDATTLLTRHEIMAIPVYRQEPSLDEHIHVRVYEYWFTAVELLKYLMSVDLDVLEAQGVSLSEVKAKLADHQWQPCVLIDPKTTLEQLFKEYYGSVDPDRGIRNYLVGDALQMQAITPTDFLRFFYLNAQESLSLILENSSGLIEGSRDFVYASLDEAAPSVLNRLIVEDRMVRVAAVHDAKHPLLLQLTSSELLPVDGQLSIDYLVHLRLRLELFLKVCGEAQSVEPFVLPSNSDLGAMIKRMLAYTVHCLWRLSQDGHPVEVVSVKDVIRYLIHLSRQ